MGRLHPVPDHMRQGRLDHLPGMMRTLPVLDVETLGDEQLQRATVLFTELNDQSLEGFAKLASDPVRRELDRRLFADVLGYNEPDMIDRLAKALNNEPTVTARH